MGPNLSGRYGDVVVQDTNETVFFSPIPDPSSRMAVIVAVTTLLAVATVALAIGSAMLAQCAAVYGLVLAFHWYAGQTGPQFTLLLRLPEHRWVIKNASPSRQQMTHGETGELKEIMLRRYFDEEGRRWVPILRWKHGYEVRNRLFRGYTLGEFLDREREARAFAEALASRLGIPVVDEPGRC